MSDNQQAPLSAERRIILVLVVSALAGIVLVGAALMYSLQRMELAQYRTHLESLASLLARQCDSEIEDAQRDLEFVSKLPAFKQMPYVDRMDPAINGVPDDVDIEKRQILAQFMNKAERFSVIYMLRPNADIYLLHPFRIQAAIKKGNLADRPYYQEAVRTKKTVMSDSFVGADGMQAVAILVPILSDNGEVTAYLGGVFYLSNLSQLVTKEWVKPFDAAYIVDRKGQLIAHTDTTLLRAGVREQFVKNHPLLSKFIASPESTAGGGQRSVLFGECTEAAEVKPHLTAIVPMNSGWALGLMRDKAAVMAETRPTVWKITSLAGLLLAVIGALGVAFAHGIGRRWDIAERALRESEEAIRKLNAELEERVVLRTAELETTNKELEAFCYSVSHDLRAPLRGMEGFSRVLLEDHAANLNADALDCLQRISAATKRMGQLIDDLLKLSHITRTAMKSEPVDMSALAAEVAAELRQSQPERIVEFVVGQTPAVKGDANLLRTALENLLANAWKFTGKLPQARIEFGLLILNGEAVFFVRDNGAGFDMTYAGKLFGAFQRLHSSSEFPGNGIGLASAQRIILRHGGRIWAESAPGKETTFYFTIKT